MDFKTSWIFASRSLNRLQKEAENVFCFMSYSTVQLSKIPWNLLCSHVFMRLCLCWTLALTVEKFTLFWRSLTWEEVLDRKPLVWRGFEQNWRSHSKDTPHVCIRAASLIWYIFHLHHSGLFYLLSRVWWWRSVMSSVLKGFDFTFH